MKDCQSHEERFSFQRGGEYVRTLLRDTIYQELDRVDYDTTRYREVVENILDIVEVEGEE